MYCATQPATGTAAAAQGYMYTSLLLVSVEHPSQLDSGPCTTPAEAMATDAAAASGGFVGDGTGAASAAPAAVATEVVTGPRSELSVSGCGHGMHSTQRAAHSMHSAHALPSYQCSE